MQIIPIPRMPSILVACLSAQLWLSTAHAHLSVQVRGTAQLDADVDPLADNQSDVTVRGRLRDELGASIAGAKLRLLQARGQSAPLQLSRVTDCSVRATSPASAFETDAEGYFCARLSRTELAGTAPLQVTFDGSENYGSTTATIALDDLRSGLSVNFGQLAHVVSLDASELAFSAELQPIAPTALGDPLPLSLELVLRTHDNGTPAERLLQRLQAKVAAPVNITLPASQLGHPGLCDLVLVFDGSRSYKPFRHLHRIERTTAVKLTVAAWPESGIRGNRLSVVARAISSTNLSPPGFVEVMGFDADPEIIALQGDGSAPLVIQIPRHPKSNFVSLSYQPSATGWRADAPLRLTLRLSPPSRWNLVGWVGAAMLVLAWLAWTRRRVEAAAAAQVASPSPRPYAHLEILEASEDPNSGWIGTIVDAHEGLAIAGALVELYRPGFDRKEQLFAALSGAQGQFDIPRQYAETDVACRMEVKANGYARLGLSLPPPGRIKVHLVSVRRAILDRLVAWTKRRGPPFDSKAEATPDWVAEVARSKGHPAIETWAKSVSLAAFGSDGPDNPERDDLLPPAGRVGAPADVKRREP